MKSLCKFSSFKLISGIFVAISVIVILFRNLLIIDLITSWGFQGVVLIEKDGEVIFKKSTLNKSRPQFLCASLIKQITSTLILREAGQGHLRLDEKANKYLEESQEIDDQIEVQHLLSHSSGVQTDNSVKFTPGSAYEYSNYGYVILGMILENVTKSSFSDLAQNLFTKLKMKDSFLVDAPTLPEIQEEHPRFVLSKKTNESQFFCIEKSEEKQFPRNPCGGLISTAEDLSRWNHQLHNGKVLPSDLYKLMVTPKIKANFPEGYYGYGICVYSQEEIYHIGYACGYKSTMSYFPKSKISLVILENDSCDDYKKDFRKHRWIRWMVSVFCKLIFYNISDGKG